MLFLISHIQECEVDFLSPAVRSSWLSVADKLARAGATVSDVSLPHFLYGVPCYAVLCAAEVSSNFAKYSGLQFGEWARDAGCSYSRMVVQPIRQCEFNSGICTLRFLCL